MRRQCPGSGAIPPKSPDEPDQWCPMCGRGCRIRNDGCIAGHPMDYARMVEHLASVVTEFERGWWEPIWSLPQRRRQAMNH